MKQGKKRRRQIVFFLLTVWSICVGIIWSAGEAKAASGERLSMKVSYGFQHTAKADRYVRLKVCLENNETEEFFGTLRVLSTESSQEVYHYEYPVSVGAKKRQAEEYDIPLGVKTDVLFLSLCDTENTELLRRRVKLNISQDVSECFVGVFCDRPERLAYMDGIGIHYGAVKTHLISLNQETAPENELGYDQLDLIVVSDYNLNQLSESQHQALSRWIDQGGTLLTGGGELYRENLGRFALTILEPPFGKAERREVNLGMEYAQNAPRDSVLSLSCADLSLKNGRTLIQGESVPLLSCVKQKKGRIAAAAFSLEEIGAFCEHHPAFLEKLLTKTFGERKVNELSQAEYYGFSNLYFSIQGLINTGDMGRLPNITLYTAVIVIYLLFIGPGIYFYLKKRKLQRYYMAGVAVSAVCFTGIIYLMGIGTRFREPFFTYAAILDTSGEEMQEKIYLNVRSPYNKPYSIRLNPSYTVRPVTKSYYYDARLKQTFNGTENYKTCLRFLPDQTEIRVRDSIAFTPKLFFLSRSAQQEGKLCSDGAVSLFDGKVSGSIVNRFEETLQDAVLIFYGKAILLGDLEPGQRVELDTLPVYQYPLSYSYALAQKATGADQYQTPELSDELYRRSQERCRLLAFYLQSELSRCFAGGRLLAFTEKETTPVFLAEEGKVSEGLTMLTSEVELDREKNGLICRLVLEEEPKVISGSYLAGYNSIYIGQPSEPVILEYFLGSDLQIREVRFEQVSEEFLNPDYSYLRAFQGEMYFYNYDTGRNDLAEQKECFTAQELEPYLSPSNTLTVKYVSTGDDENGWEASLPMLYAVGEVK